MTRIAAFHSFRRGTGRTSLLTNAAATLAQQGKRVGVVDINLRSPSAHILFRLDNQEMEHTLDNFLWGECRLEQTIYDVSTQAGLEKDHLFLIPSSDNMARIMRILKEGFEINALAEAFGRFTQLRKLDHILLDLSSGITEEVLLTMSIADVLINVMRLDEQDYQGVTIMLDVAKQLEIPESLVVVNQVPASFDLEDVKTQISKGFNCRVGNVFPHTNEFAVLASEGLFVVEYPQHPFTKAIGNLAERL